jgi:hypothetical protein
MAKLVQHTRKHPRHPQALVNLSGCQVVLSCSNQITLPPGQDTELTVAVGHTQVVADFLPDGQALSVQLTCLVIVTLVTSNDGQVVQDIGSVFLVVDLPLDGQALVRQTPGLNVVALEMSNKGQLMHGYADIALVTLLLPEHQARLGSLMYCLVIPLTIQVGAQIAEETGFSYLIICWAAPSARWP